MVRQVTAAQVREAAEWAAGLYLGGSRDRKVKECIAAASNKFDVPYGRILGYITASGIYALSGSPTLVAVVHDDDGPSFFCSDPEAVVVVEADVTQSHFHTPVASIDVNALEDMEDQAHKAVLKIYNPYGAEGADLSV